MAVSTVDDLRAPGFGLTIGALALSVLVLNYARASNPEELLLALDNDSAMRLVQVRDLLGGQNWFDLTQYRLGLQDGVEMHWSRLIDAPLALLVAAFGVLLKPIHAEFLVLLLWPALWFAVAATAVIRTAARMGGKYAAFYGFIAAGLSFVFVPHFRPGSIDHHNVQMGLFLLALMGIAWRHEHDAYPILAGFSAAFSLAIGVEALPQLAVASLGVAVLWVVYGATELRSTLLYGAALSAALLVLFGLTSPASAYYGGFCDTFSVDLLVPVMLAGSALAFAAAVLPSQTPFQRLTGLGALIACLGVMTAVLLPACLSNPLSALHPFLRVYWLSNVSEAQNILGALENRFYMYFGYIIFGATGLLLCLIRPFRELAGDLGILIGFLLLLTLAMAAYQVRSSVFVTGLACLPVAVFGAHLKSVSIKSRSVLPALWAACLVFFSAPPACALAFFGGLKLAEATGFSEGHAKARRSHMLCFQDDGFAVLQELPSGLVAATSNLGSQILLHAPHRVLAAPYHRNQTGMIAQFKIAFSATAAEAAERMRSLGVDYLVICSEDPEAYLEERGSTKSPLFVRLMQEGASLPGYRLLSSGSSFFIFGRADL